MYDWCQEKDMIKQNSSQHQSDTWDSDEKHLFEIIDQAEKWGIEPKKPERIKLSNLRSIIKKARDAIKRQDRARFQELIDWASYLDNRELRLKLGSAKLESIPIVCLPESEKYQYQILVTGEQLKAIQVATKTQFCFKLESEQPSDQCP